MFRKKINLTDSTTHSEMPFLSHLVELRNRILRSLGAVLVLFLGLFPFANDLYEWLSEPLLRYLPEGTSMIATEVASPFFAPMKLAIVAAIFIAMPVIAYQMWAFVAPGLYKNEKRFVYPLMITSTMLFYLGAAFAYFVVFPLVFGFFTSVAPEGVEVATDISKYLDFVLKLFFAFGLAFEVPIATVLLVKGGFTTPKAMAAKRPYIILSAFVLGMLLTPPDMISQTLLALPMWVLFELGLVFSRLYASKQEKEAEGDEVEEADKSGEEGDNPADEYRYAPISADTLDESLDVESDRK